MRRKWRKFWIRVSVLMRLIRLSFLRVEVPEDAMTQEEMLAAIKKRLNLT